MIYAIDENKNHYLIDEKNHTWAGQAGEYRFAQADADGWIEFSGKGEPPLPSSALCFIKMGSIPGRGGKPCPANSWGWRAVTHYRPIIDQPASEETKGWGGPEDGFPPGRIEVLVKHHELGWTGATTIGRFGKYMVCAPNGGGFYGYSIDEIKPAPTPREQWVEKARKVVSNAGSHQFAEYEAIYDALASGELEAPKVEQ